MAECLISLSKGEDDVGCLQFCNILKWSTTVQGKITELLIRKHSAL